MNLIRKLLGLKPKNAKVPPHVAEMEACGARFHAHLAAFQSRNGRAAAQLHQIREKAAADHREQELRREDGN